MRAREQASTTSLAGKHLAGKKQSEIARTCRLILVLQVAGGHVNFFVLFCSKMRIANLISFPVSLRVMQISGVSYNDFLHNYDCLVANLVNYIVRGNKLFSLFIHGYIPYAVNKKQVIFQVLHGNHGAFARGLQ